MCKLPPLQGNKTTRQGQGAGSNTPQDTANSSSKVRTPLPALRPLGNVCPVYQIWHPPISNPVPLLYYCSSAFPNRIFSDALIQGADFSQLRSAFYEKIIPCIKMRYFDKQETELFLSIFQQEFTYLLYERIALEISSSGNQNLIKLYDNKKDTAAGELPRQPSPQDTFVASKLWFATFSTNEVPGITGNGPTKMPYAGSIYFDGGRLRLIHPEGPVIETHPMIRTLGGEILYSPNEYKKAKSPTGNSADSSLEKHLERLKAAHPNEPLREYWSGNKIDSNPVHTSRGIPKMVRLLDTDIMPLFHLMKRLSTIRYTRPTSSSSYRPFSSQVTRNVNNKILVDFIQHSGQICRILGYDQFVGR